MTTQTVQTHLDTGRTANPDDRSTHSHCKHNRSTILARWHQCAYLSNTQFLEPTLL